MVTIQETAHHVKKLKIVLCYVDENETKRHQNFHYDLKKDKLEKVKSM